MAIKRGLRNNARKHARNFTHEQAQKRLTETVAAFNNQVSNSLKVDAVKIDLYRIERMVGHICTCYKSNTTVRDMDDEIGPVVPNKSRTNESPDVVFQSDDIFGNTQFSEMIMNDVDVTPAGKTISISGGGHDDAVIGVLEQEDEGFDTADGGSVNCGICYRTTRVPAFRCFGKQRTLLTTHVVEDIQGVTINSTEAPHTFEAAHRDGYVAFLVNVPRYFDYVKVSVRNNLTVLKVLPLDQRGNKLSAKYLREHAGKQAKILVKTDVFTHVVMEFDLGVEKIHANIGGENTTLDYDRLVTLSDIPVVLGPEVSNVDNGDVICIPERGLYMKVRDRERKITSDQRRLEWVLSTRVLQPTEPLKDISKGYKLV